MPSTTRTHSSPRRNTHPSVRRGAMRMANREKGSNVHLCWNPKNDQWEVRGDQAQRASFKSPRRTEALRRAKDIAERKGASLITHSKNEGMGTGTASRRMNGSRRTRRPVRQPRILSENRPSQAV